MVTLFAALLGAGCGMAMDAREAPGADGDAGSDADVDSDGDGDVDSDLDLGESRDAPGSCTDGADNDMDGLVDCFALGCREDSACCGELVVVATDAFDAGIGATWTPFGAPQISTGSLYFPGAEHESGLVFGDPLDAHGLVEVSAVVDRPAGCAGCAAYGGVALTAQSAIGDESGVRPIAALAFSAMDDAVHVVVDGEAVYATEALLAPVTLRLRLLADGAVEGEWTDSVGTTGSDLFGPATRPDTDLSVAIYGRGGMQADDVVVSRAGCMGPQGGIRLGAILAPSGWSAGGVRAPSVVRTDSRWLLYYDGAAGIGRAESADGLAWVPTPANAILAGPYASPGVLEVDPGAAGGRLLFVETWDDPAVHRIVAMRSVEADGLSFGEALVAVETDSTLASARDPHPVAANGQLAVYFSAVDTEGRSAIGVTLSDDSGFTWTPPAIVLPAGAEDADGLFAPAVVVGPSGWEMWFEVRDGVTSRIEFAVSSDGLDWERAEALEDRLVLSPGDGFDARAVSDPFVVVDSGVSRLYYAGASDTAYSIGLVERFLP